MSEQLELLPTYFTAHLQLTLLSLFLAALFSVPMGVLAVRTPWLRQAVLGVAGVIQTIPGLALLAVMVPILTFIGFQGIGFLPAVIGLTLYCVLPILMGTVTGIAEVDAAVIEAARGVGMTPAQQLRMVEFPLAMPVIVAGFRTATVWCVGMATLSTPVGAPSLGNYIFGGLQTRNYTAVLVGCVAAAVLAQVLDRLVMLFEIGVRRRRRMWVLSSAGMLAAIALYSAGAAAASMAGGGEVPVRIGAKTFTEQHILAEMMAQRVEGETSHPTEVLHSLGSTVAFDALVAGDIDAYVDYSGTIWATIMKRKEFPERAELLRRVRRYLEEERGVVVAASLGFENTYAVAMRRDRARELGVVRIGDLAPHARGLSMGGDYEFFSREEWTAIRTTYALEFSELRFMDSSLMYQAVEAQAVDVISAYSTDGRIAALDLLVLEDNRRAIPPYDALILVSAALARDKPEVVEALKALESSIDADRMRRLNQDVDANGRSPSAVAAGLLREISR